MLKSAIFLSLLPGTVGVALAGPVPCEPVSPHATPEARALLKTICALSGKGILAGQHNFVGNGSRFSDYAADVTGRYPYVWGSDFGFAASGKDGIDSREKMIAEARRQYAAGSVITLMWHAVKPTDDEPNDWRTSVCGKLTDGVPGKSRAETDLLRCATSRPIASAVFFLRRECFLNRSSPANLRIYLDEGATQLSITGKFGHLTLARSPARFPWRCSSLAPGEPNWAGRPWSSNCCAA